MCEKQDQILEWHQPHFLFWELLIDLNCIHVSLNTELNTGGSKVYKSKSHIARIFSLVGIGERGGAVGRAAERLNEINSSLLCYLQPCSKDSPSASSDWKSQWEIFGVPLPPFQPWIRLGEAGKLPQNCPPASLDRYSFELSILDHSRNGKEVP